MRMRMLGESAKKKLRFVLGNFLSVTGENSLAAKNVAISEQMILRFTETFNLGDDSLTLMKFERKIDFWVRVCNEAH